MRLMDKRVYSLNAHFEPLWRRRMAGSCSRDGLNLLLGLCSSNWWCTQEVKEWLSQATAPVEIRIMAGSGGFRAAVAQYETQSDEQLRRKIQQFPAGTVFRLVSSGSIDNQARAEVEQIVRSAGYSLAAQ